MSNIFRQSALDKLSSPEQLDKVMKVTHSKAWVALLGVSVILGLTVVWSFVGRVATTVGGQGILIKSGGLHDIASVEGGQISAIYVQDGDFIQKGQVVARLAQPNLSQELEKAKSRLEEMKREHQQLLRLGSEGKKLRSRAETGRRANLLSVIRADRERLNWLNSHVRKQENLLKQGLLTNQAVQTTRQEIQQVRSQIESARNQLQSISVSTQESSGQKEREVLRSQLNLNETERQIETLQDRLELASRVISTRAGRVLEIRVSKGEVVHSGRSLITLEPTGSEGLGLEAMIYVPVEQGKLLRPGMRTRVSPMSVKKEEYGVMVGIVTHVSEFPSTQAGMKRILQNDLFVQSLLGKIGLAPIAIKVELIPNVNAPSGFRWTSREGPPTSIGPGTPCTAAISVKEHRPVEMVIPAIRKLLGV